MASLKAFTMPKWGIEMTEGTLTEWMVAEGKPFAKGDLLTAIETEKINNEVEAEADDCFVRLLARAGKTYPVGALLGVLGPAGTSAAEIDAFIAAFKPADTAMAGQDDVAPAASLASPAAVAIPDGIAISPAARAKAMASGVDVTAVKGSGSKGRISLQDIDKTMAGERRPELKGAISAAGQENVFASPLARRIAVQNGIDLSAVTGTGHRGRISRHDVLARIASAREAAPAAGDFTVVSMSSQRRTIAARLTQAQTIPHFILRRRMRADRVIALRENQGKTASLNDYIVRATALALCEVPQINIQIHGHDIYRFAHADVAVAVSTPRGLITPIIAGADTLSVTEISARMSDLGSRARAGKLQPNEFQGGSFTVSNLGMFGVEEFDAILNPPQGAILAVGKARPEPVDEGGAIRVMPVFHFSLNCDHRAIDGADGAKFLEALNAILEKPERL